MYFNLTLFPSGSVKNKSQKRRSDCFVFFVNIKENLIVISHTHDEGIDKFAYVYMFHSFSPVTCL